jgi:hypothetical protein
LLFILLLHKVVRNQNSASGIGTLLRWMGILHGIQSGSNTCMESSFKMSNLMGSHLISVKDLKMVVSLLSIQEPHLCLSHQML